MQRRDLHENVWTPILSIPVSTNLTNQAHTHKQCSPGPPTSAIRDHTLPLLSQYELGPCMSPTPGIPDSLKSFWDLVVGDWYREWKLSTLATVPLWNFPLFHLNSQQIEAGSWRDCLSPHSSTKVWFKDVSSMAVHIACFKHPFGTLLEWLFLVNEGLSTVNTVAKGSEVRQTYIWVPDICFSFSVSGD